MNKSVMLVLLIWLAGSFAAAHSPIDPHEARPHVDWRDAQKVVGRIAFVSGRVANVRTVERITFLDFGDETPPTFAGVIQASDLGHFATAPEQTYRGKILRVRGYVSTFRGVPQIAITSPDQIEICAELPPTEEPPPARHWEPQSTFRVATLNTLNLFDDVDDPYTLDETTPPKPRPQLAALAKTIRSLDADVIALEEVENRGIVERFLEVFLPDMGYSHVVEFDGNDLRGTNVALISRMPIGPVRSNRHIEFDGPAGKPMRFARDVLNVTVKPSPAQAVQIWVVHLRSNSQGREFTEPIRIAEAREIRALLDEELTRDPNACILVAGDFNDTWESETLRTVVGSAATAFWSTAFDYQGPAPITYNQEPHRSMIDFILCSPAMAKHYVKGTYRIVPGSPEETGSDHNPVVAEFAATPTTELSSR